MLIVPPAQVKRLPLVRLPTFKGFQHKVKVNPNVNPVQQKLSLNVHSKVSKKLEELELQGVIRKIHASEWVSPYCCIVQI